MKFGKSICAQAQADRTSRYVDYKRLKKLIKEVIEHQRRTHLDEAMSANSLFENELSREIQGVNDCFLAKQQELMGLMASFMEDLPYRGKGPLERLACWGADLSDEGDQHPRYPHGGNPFKRLVGLLGDVHRLRQYAVWNSVAIVKILKKRRKQTTYGLEDVETERAGWLARQSCFSGSEFAELQGTVESLGFALVKTELAPEVDEKICPEQTSCKEVERCPICLDTISDTVSLTCGHQFCWKCFILGPIAYQQGEYRISQCPICRKDTVSTDSSGNDASCATEDVLGRFLKTYFPQGRVEELDLEAQERADAVEEKVRSIVGGLVKTLHSDSFDEAASSAASWEGDPPGAQDFFQTLQPRVPCGAQAIANAQKLHWLQIATAGDPLALDMPSVCSLCSEPLIMEAVVTTPCKHHFHRSCVQRLSMPLCPLCVCPLPFTWYLPEDHPCRECGFRVIPGSGYRPRFPGGPDYETAGWPLKRPPPAVLFGPGGMQHMSFLHFCRPLGEDSDEEGILQRRTQRQRSASGASSLSESTDSDESDAHSRGSRGAHLWSSWAYSAKGKMRFCHEVPSADSDGPLDDELRDCSAASSSGAAPPPRRHESS